MKNLRKTTLVAGGLTLAGGLAGLGMLLNQLFSGVSEEDIKKLSEPTQQTIQVERSTPVQGIPSTSRRLPYPRLDGALLSLQQLDETSHNRVVNYYGDNPLPVIRGVSTSEIIELSKQGEVDTIIIYPDILGIRLKNGASYFSKKEDIDIKDQLIKVGVSTDASGVQIRDATDTEQVEIRKTRLVTRKICGESYEREISYLINFLHGSLLINTLGMSEQVCFNRTGLEHAVEDSAIGIPDGEVYFHSSLAVYDSVERARKAWQIFTGDLAKNVRMTTPYQVMLSYGSQISPGSIPGTSMGDDSYFLFSRDRRDEWLAIILYGRSILTMQLSQDYGRPIVDEKEEFVGLARQQFSAVKGVLERTK